MAIKEEKQQESERQKRCYYAIHTKSSTGQPSSVIHERGGYIVELAMVRIDP